MKKNIFIIITVLTLGFFGCQKEFEPGGTELKDASGTWMLFFDGDGPYEAMTYNTAANVDNEMWLTDDGNYWDFLVKLPIDLGSLKFGTADSLVNQVAGYDIKIVVTDGKILKGAATPPSGLPVDSISFKIYFADQSGTDPIEVGGYRYTGWPEDE